MRRKKEWVYLPFFGPRQSAILHRQRSRITGQIRSRRSLIGGGWTPWQIDEERMDPDPPDPADWGSW